MKKGQTLISLGDFFVAFAIFLFLGGAYVIAAARSAIPGQGTATNGYTSLPVLDTSTLTLSGISKDAAGYAYVVFTDEAKKNAAQENIALALRKTGNIPNNRYLVAWTKEKIECFDTQIGGECFPCYQYSILQNKCGPETFTSKTIILPSTKDVSVAFLKDLERKS